MSKKCFLSFNYKPDNWRVQQVKQIGAIEEQPLLEANKWEEIKARGPTAIQNWIDDNLKGKQCLIVLIGEKTAGRPWVKYEIEKAWSMGMGVFGVHVHNLKDPEGMQAKKGADPFAGVTAAGKAVVGKVYDPPYLTSTNVYDHIKNNVEGWIDAAIAARKK